ncbi:MAG: hypothetical protein H6Q90_5577 [Deltaproteobacteria bacterium]|nr:hypothetical protein [Deltaproteobacteria bacterium]
MRLAIVSWIALAILPSFAAAAPGPEPVPGPPAAPTPADPTAPAPADPAAPAPADPAASNPVDPGATSPALPAVTSPAAPMVTKPATTAVVGGPRPALAATLALLFPGAGHAYVGNWGRAAGLFGTEAALIGGGFLLDHATDDKALGRHYLVGVGANIHMYGVFDAYREARRRIGDRGYRHPVDKASYTDLLLAPVSPSAMFEWRTMAVASTFIALGVGLRVAFHRENYPDGLYLGNPKRTDNIFGHDVDPYAAFSLGVPVLGPKYANVGLGEEALFRGVVQSGMSEWWGPGWANLGQATVFSLFHVINPQYGFDPAAYFQALGAGLAFGWLQEKTHDLRHSTAAHAWIDFAGSLTAYLFDPGENPLAFNVQMPI